MSQGAHDMMSYLEETLKQLEEAQGGQDPQARAMMEALRVQLLGAEAAASAPLPAMRPQADGGADSELQLASQLDSLEGQLDALQRKIRSAPEETKELLGQSAALWQGQQPPK